ncbi:MAG: ComEA family DNA-binding protein [Erysipelotrichaceae bacterium]|nr:ComEA family DNA-binding protein [Erysipelotrichaceae bacterium]
MKFIIIVAICTGIYVCAMDIVSKFTSSLDFTSTSNIVEVSISGEVTDPGTYYLPKGAVLKDLVAYAGGFTDCADVSNLTASETLKNNANYYVPTSKVEETKIMISLNEASLSELETIPGIGNSLAARIVAYRVENGNFTSIEQLCNIKGIKEETLEKIKSYIYIE